MIPLLVLIGGVARADTSVCIGASERAQQLRSDGKLVAAKVSFLACAEDDCPAAVKKDCAKALEELAPVIPSVIIAVREADGTDADPSRLKVTIDGVVEPDTVGGRSVQIDPGAHHVHVDTPRGPMNLDFVAREGEVHRTLTLQLPARDAAARPPPGPVVDPSASEADGHTVAPWVIFGIGAAALAGGTVAIVIGESSVGPSNATTAGAIAAGVGLVAIAVGLVWHFLEPTGPSRPSHKDIFWRVGPSGFALMSF